MSSSFNDEKCAAGKHSFTDSLKRHPKLSLRRPEPTSVARATGSNKQAVHAFYDLLENLMGEFGVQYIYDTDET